MGIRDVLGLADFVRFALRDATWEHAVFERIVSLSLPITYLWRFFCVGFLCLGLLLYLFGLLGLLYLLGCHCLENALLAGTCWSLFLVRYLFRLVIIPLQGSSFPLSFIAGVFRFNIHAEQLLLFLLGI